MRNGQVLTDDELRQWANQLIEKSGKRAADIARELDIGRPLISRALNSTEDVGTKTLRRIVGHLSKYDVELRLVVVKKS